MLADLRGGRAFVAAELSRPGWLDFGSFRWSDLALAQGLRAAIGVLTPLAIGVAAGRVEYGSFAALGAFPAGFVSFRGVNRTRVLAVLCASAGMAVSTFVGATAAREPVLLIPVVFVWAYVVGLLAALGPTVLAVTLQWPVALLIASALPLGPTDAALRAGLVLAGGLWQCLLVVTSWTVNRGSAERAALATTYFSLSDYAVRLAAGASGPASPTQLPASRALGDPNPLMRTAARLHMRDLADEADRIRSTLTTLSISGDGVQAPDVRALLGAAARVLNELAAGLDGRTGDRAQHVAAANHELGGVRTGAGTTWRWVGEALLGQLRSASRILNRLNEAEPTARSGAPPRPIRQAWRLDTLLTLRASVGTSTESGRHALRLAVVAAVAEAIVHAAGLSHGYWAVLTIFIVLRTDYSSTLYRGLQRAAGTLVGAGLGLATVQLARISMTALLAGIGISLFAAYAVLTVNYLLYGVFLTDFVVVLLALLGLPPEPTAFARLAGTGLGTGLAILAYLLWPTWEGTSAAEKFARLFAAQGRYASALLRSYSRPGSGSGSADLDQLRIAARRARLDAEASADRLAGEPDHPPVTVRRARALQSAGHRIAQADIALGVVVAAHHSNELAGAVADANLQNGLDRLADGVTDSVGQLAAALRAAGPQGPEPPDRLPRLRALQRAIWLRLARPDAQPSDEAVGLLAATDSLVDAINTAAHALGG